MSTLSQALFGRRERLEQVPTVSPQQQQFLTQLLGQIQRPLGAGIENLQQLISGDVSAFEKPAMRQFQEEIIPGIAERFSGLGAGAQQSSAFQQALGGAGAGLAERLGMQRAGLQQQGLSQLMGLLGPALTQQQQPIFRPGTPGLFGALAGGLGSALGTAGGLGLGRLLGGI